MALVGNYELGRILGRGAFAKVYHARNLRTGQSVAIKVIIKSKIAGTPLMSNIMREISIIRRLRHSNIVRLIEILATRTKIYFVMDLVKGGELFHKISKSRFSEDLARKLFRQLISAIGYCHFRGVFHRDLKPENLLIDENGDLKVSDFGLSAIKEHAHRDQLLHTMCGTPAYVAPDILANKGYEGAKVDVWSCGIILFVLTAGFLPFNDPSLMMLYKKIYSGAFNFPKWMSPDLKLLLSRLLDTNPNTRITIDDVTRDPWFVKGEYEKLSFLPDSDFKDWDAGVDDEALSCTYRLNAFDLISFSQGLDLSGLVNGSPTPMVDVERFVSKVSVEMIVERIEGLTMAENLEVSKVKKKNGGARIEMVGEGGELVGKVEIGQLTEELVVVEVKRKVGDASLFNELWKNKIRLQIQDLVYGVDR